MTEYELFASYLNCFQAVAKENFDLVKFLLNHNVRTNVIDMYGKTPVEEAQHHGFQEIVQLFEEHENKGNWGGNDLLDSNCFHDGCLRDELW